MSTDELSTPLGQKRKRKPRLRLPFTMSQAIATVLVLFVLGFAGIAIFNHDPLGGEPVARLDIKPDATADDKAKSADKSADKPAEAAQDPHGKEQHGKAEIITPKPAGDAKDTAGHKTVNIIDGSKGTQESVVIPGGADDSAPGEMAISATIDPKLLEQSRYGMVPVAAAGMKPFTAYTMATDADRAKADKMPTIAIVVTGLGIGAARTNDAAMKLPAAVTLAFTPYGTDPGKLVEAARSRRHEVVLQIPMEPFDYPDNDPGPQTLLSTAAPEQNIDRLMWHLSRFQGYVGVSNFMGAKFVATDAAMQPIIRDAARRGLSYLDDGSAPRSVAGTLAKSMAMPFARADLALDTVPSGPDIDKALARLETIAKERGNAIGTVSALPVAIERLVAWSKTLEARGILLVPLTTATLKSKST